MNLNKDEKSFLLYVETCAVDKSFQLESIRMNEDDFSAAKTLEEKGILKVVRLKYGYIKAHKSFNRTHFCWLTKKGWGVAWDLRKARAMRLLVEYGPTNGDLRQDVIPENFEEYIMLSLKGV